MPKRLAKKLLIIGWDGADWQIAKPLMERGEMPVLADLVSHGVMGNLSSMEPMVSPILWTTMATGRSPQDHGICGFREPAPETELGTRLTSSTSRRCKAFWNILTQNGINCNVVAWYAGHPAEPIRGVCVSEMLARPIDLEDKPWPVPPGAVHPDELRDTLADLRIHPQDIALEQLEYFVPRAKEIDQREDALLSKLAIQLSQCATNHAAATWILETQPWEVLAVYLSTIDNICHGFMYYHPPKMPAPTQRQFDLYHDVINATYRFHDLMLSRLLKLAGDDTTVMLISDHGYQTGHRRPQLTPNEPAGPVIWHRPFGVLAMRGPGIKQDELVFGSSIADVTPTILSLLGLPVGEDMIGRVVVQAFVEPPKIETVSSWEDIPGDAGQHSEEFQIDPLAEQAAMQQLIELGYVESLPADKQQRIEVAVNEQNYNLGRALAGLGDYEGALAQLEPLHQRCPQRLMVALHLADCYQRAGRLDDCRRLLDYVASGACFDAGLEDRNVQVVPQLDLLYGLLELNSGNLEAAHERLIKAEKQLGHSRGLHTNLGNLYRMMDRWDDAGVAFGKALETDPDDPAALAGMASVHLNLKRYDLAISCALQSLSILYHQPRVHYYLALGLANLGQPDRAREALDVALRMRPGFEPARDLLSKLSALAK